MASSVLVYGGSGALGAAVVAHFAKKSFRVISVDLRANAAAAHSVILSLSDSWEQQAEKVNAEVSAILGSDKLSSIFCVAGGWAGGNASDASALIKSSDLMWKQSVQSSIIAATVAAKFLKANGLLQLTGSLAALNGTAGMIGYGIAKAAVHQLTKSLAAGGSGLPEGAKTIAILPVTLDTPANRAGMPSADFSSWTKVEVLAEKFEQWTTSGVEFDNGALIKVVTASDVTTFSNAEN